MITEQVRIILFFLAIISFAQSPSLAKLSAAPPELISFWRLTLASLAMALIGHFRGEGSTHFKALRSKAGVYALLSGLFFWIHLWCFQFAAQNTSVANVMILFSTNPIFTGLISVGLFKEKFEKRLIPVYLLAMLGIYILVSHNLHLDSANTPGDLAALASSFLFSFYILFGHQARKTVSNTTYTYFIYAVAGTCFFFTTYFRGVDFIHYPSITWISIVGLVLIPTLMGHALFTYLLRFINVNWLSMGKLAEPVIASFTAYLLFSETWNRTTLLAFACTLLSLLLLIQPWKHIQGRRTTS